MRSRGGRARSASARRWVHRGIVLGLPLAVAAASLSRSLLFGVTATDPATYGVTVAVLGTVALAACALPSARALRVDPVVCLRDE